MTELLIRLLVHGHRDPEDPTVRERYGAMAGGVGIAVNLILSAVKLLAGILSGSVAITADALNNLSDAGSSVMTLIGFRLSSRPADRDHPFGHARMEYLSSLVVSFLILLVGAELLMDSGRSLLGLRQTQPLQLSLLTLVILVCSVLGKLWLALFYHKLARRIDSSVLYAAATDSRNDVISTLAVLLSAITVHLTGWQWLDAAVGIAVAGIILLAGLRILMQTKDSLLGEGPVEETVTAIRNIVAEYPEIIGIHDLLVHNYGPRHLIASFHAEVDGSKDIFALHDAVDNVERRIAEELHIPCTVHMDPILCDDARTAALRTLATAATQEVDPRMTLHDFRAVTGPTHTNLIFDVVLPYESPLSEGEVRQAIAAAIQRHDPTLYSVITVDRG